MSYETAKKSPVIQRIGELYPRGIDLSLSRIKVLLAELGHPERRLPPVVHVAGTNGKGSFIAFLRAMLEAAGYKAHVYTSPHLVRFNERIVLAGEIITTDRLVPLLERCEAINRGRPITFFEITTLAAFLAFAETKADISLIEVGMGGRLDATNVITSPILSVITPVDLDHTDHLGSTITAIAKEKAEIIKAGTLLILGRQKDEAKAAITYIAEQQKTTVSCYGKDWWPVVTEKGRLQFTTQDGFTINTPPPSLAGLHQYENAATAIAAALSLKPHFQRLTPEAICHGVANALWPARLQRLTCGPLLDILQPGSEIWIDGGHNPHAGEALAATLLNWRHDGLKLPVDLVVAMRKNKDAAGFLAPFVSFARNLVTTRIANCPLAAGPDDLAAAAREIGFNDVITTNSPEEALQVLKAQGQSPGRILICGSLYLGELLEKR